MEEANRDSQLAGMAGNEDDEDAMNLAMADADLQHSLSDCCDMFASPMFDQTTVPTVRAQGQAQTQAQSQGREASSGQTAIGVRGEPREEQGGGTVGAERDGSGGEANFFSQPRELQDKATVGSGASPLLLNMPEADPFQVRGLRS